MYEELIDTREKDGFTINTYACEEDIPVRGNALVSGDDKLDKRVENRIIKQLENGNLSHWFCAKVTASKSGVELSSDYLGACSYSSFKDFLKPGDYHADMVERVIEMARETIAKLTK